MLFTKIFASLYIFKSDIYVHCTAMICINAPSDVFLQNIYLQVYIHSFVKNIVHVCRTWCHSTILFCFTDF